MVKWICICEEWKRVPVHVSCYATFAAISGRMIYSDGFSSHWFSKISLEVKYFSTCYSLTGRMYENLLQRISSCSQHSLWRWIWLHEFFTLTIRHWGQLHWRPYITHIWWINYIICYDCTEVLKKDTHMHPSLIHVSFADFLLPRQRVADKACRKKCGQVHSDSEDHYISSPLSEARGWELGQVLLKRKHGIRETGIRYGICNSRAH